MMIVNKREPWQRGEGCGECWECVCGGVVQNAEMSTETEAQHVRTRLWGVLGFKTGSSILVRLMMNRQQRLSQELVASCQWNGVQSRSQRHIQNDGARGMGQSFQGRSM